MRCITSSLDFFAERCQSDALNDRVKSGKAGKKPPVGVTAECLWANKKRKMQLEKVVLAFNHKPRVGIKELVVCAFVGLLFCCSFFVVD